MNNAIVNITQQGSVLLHNAIDKVLVGELGEGTLLLENSDGPNFELYVGVRGIEGENKEGLTVVEPKEKTV